MNKYRKKPVVIEAWQVPKDAMDAVDLAAEISALGCNFEIRSGEKLGIYIKTLEGIMKAYIGDYIIKGIKGEFYPCKPDIFLASYEKVEEPTNEENEA